MSVQLGLAMPQPGETITEGVVIRWIKKEGDMIKEKDPVVELETAKAVYDFESPLEGKLVKILVQPNETQQVGKALAIVECDDAHAQKYLMFGVAIPLDAAPQAAAPSPLPPGGGLGRGGSALPPSPLVGEGSLPRATTRGGEGSLQYSPLIRTLAQENGIPLADLAKIPATGPGGKLSKEDVLNYARRSLPPGGGSEPAPGLTRGRGGSSPVSPNFGVTASTRTEVSAVRKRIAENLHLSKTVIPHAGSAVDIDVTELIKLRESKKVSYAPFFMMALLEAIKKYPHANNFYIVDGDKHSIQSNAVVNIGFAVGAKQGLVVPVIKSAQSKTFAELTQAVAELVGKAKENKLSPDDLTGGTITVNNPGALGSTRGNQIIVYPQAIIVGFQKMVERPAVVNGKIEVRTIMECGCSFDHRILDGVEAVGFLEAIRNVLENPTRYFGNI